MSMSNSQEVLTSVIGDKKKKPRTDIYSPAVVSRNDDQLSRPHYSGYCCPTINQRNSYRSGDDGDHLLRFCLDLCSGADPRRCVLDRFGNKLTYTLAISSGHCLLCYRVSPSALNLCCSCAWGLASVKRPVFRRTVASSVPGSLSTSAPVQQLHIRLVNI